MNWLSRLFGTKDIKPDPMKYLIVGLGNIGPDYYQTRHNVGFEVLDYLAEQKEVEFEPNKLGATTEFKFKGRTFLLLKPSTYMNLSGKAVRYWMEKHKIQSENLLVVVDDLNLDFGKTRLRGKGAAGGHNGLKNIEQVLGRNNYPRLKVGIGNDYRKGQQVDFVLGKWTAEEREGLDRIMDHSAKAILAFGTIGLQRTMSQFNK